MSVEHTCEHQAARLEQIGLRTAWTRELTDLDTFDEAVEVARVATGARFGRAVEDVLGTVVGREHVVGR